MRLGQLDAIQQGAGIDLPFTCGHETAGWVAEVGSGVTHVRVGDSVLLHPQSTCGCCRAGDDMHCTAATFPGLLIPAGSPSTLRPARAPFRPSPRAWIQSASLHSATPASPPTAR
jgi:NAD+-dependent secondary alcohol dehydrogenase Adh1